MAMDYQDLANIVHKASKDAVPEYLGMCGLDSPWEIPEVYIAIASARALAQRGFRAAIEFNLARADNAPPSIDLAMPARLQKAYSPLDLVILRREPDRSPWTFTIDGIIEFKKSNWMADDGDLIDYMVHKKGIKYGLLVLFINGRTAKHVQENADKYTLDLLKSGKWFLASKPAPSEYLPLQNTNASEVGDQWWDICCLHARPVASSL